MEFAAGDECGGGKRRTWLDVRHGSIVRSRADMKNQQPCANNNSDTADIARQDVLPVSILCWFHGQFGRQQDGRNTKIRGRKAGGSVALRGISVREDLIERVFLGELLRGLWRKNVRDLEFLRLEVDSGGYDLALEFKGVTRHVQLKSSFTGGTVLR